MQRVEVGLVGKEVDEKLRREGDTCSMERKFLDMLKRKLRKKRVIAEAARQVRNARPSLCRGHRQKRV